MKSGASSTSFPDSFHFDERVRRRWKPEILDCPTVFLSGPPSLELTNAQVFPDGSIVANTRLHPWSALYHKTSPYRLLSVSASTRSTKALPRLRKAVVLSRGNIMEGTYGDYVIEFLLPLSWAADQIHGSTLLLDTAAIQKHGPEDLAKLGLPFANVPASGVFVENLIVVGPCQPWDNFRKANIDRVKARFPVQSAPSAPERVYLSRVGLPIAADRKQARSLVNEEEVELALEQEGFVILRTHLLPNDKIRALLAGAKVIVAQHGAAMAHLIWARPEHVVELASDDWWVPCYSKLCRALNVRTYRVLCADRGKIDVNLLRETVVSIHCK